MEKSNLYDNYLLEDFDEKEVFCDFCNTSSKQFLKTGYVGCEQCYKTFSHIIMPMLKNYHKKTKHFGKFIVNGFEDETLSQKIANLTKQLNICVENEQYEKASQIKLQINKLKEEAYE